MSFVIYALVQYARASDESVPLEQAMDLFYQLEEHCYDTTHGGYREFFYDDWREVRDPNESGYVGAIGSKTYNTHLHLMEAFTSLHRQTNDALVAKRLGELVQINTVTVKHPLHPCNVDGWNADWSMIQSADNLRASYGHDVECVWLALDANETLGRQPDTLRSWAVALSDHAILRGWDQHEGHLFAAANGWRSQPRAQTIGDNRSAMRIASDS